MPLSGGSRPSSTESLSLSSLSADDIPLFACFPNLKSIDASGCTDYEALLALRSAYPALDLTAFVTVSGKAVPMDAQRAVLRARYTACGASGNTALPSRALQGILYGRRGIL